MKQLPGRINLVTLGVSNVPRSSRFYQALGFAKVRFDSEAISFFQLDGTVLAVFGREALAEDAGVAVPETSSGAVTLAICFPSREQVDSALAFAEKAGGRITQPAREVFWGGYSGYFADPDDHLWELAYNPVFALSDAGHFNLPTESTS